MQLDTKYYILINKQIHEKQKYNNTEWFVHILDKKKSFNREHSNHAYMENVKIYTHIFSSDKKNI